MTEEFHDVVPQSSSRLLGVAKDLTAGAAGGIVQVLLGQPFDIVKVRLQAQSGGTIAGTVRNIWVNEGPRAFYKGTLLPLIGIGACVSIQFGAFHSVRQALEAYNCENHGHNNAKLSLPQVYMAGAFAGVANSVLAGPIEHIRIKLQTQPDGQKRLYSGPGDCMQKVMRQRGVAGLFRGQVLTLGREFHGFGIWFATYEVLMEWTARVSEQKRENLPGWKVALCGGVAGDALWLATYPLDVLKTKVQSDVIGNGQLYKSGMDAFRQTWRQTGVRGFFSGIIPTLVRSIFTSAGTFVAFENAKKALM